ncbi:lipopolysaccharide biosynthesis protein [Citrobacter braakii]|uniref:lipopolysaccharide biosynthesis protein n=1 Tax=Citrobacter braakii TaxID=57706 RepID=UPI001C2299D3|nr:hypothetical protein [Citrobacter braakii]QXA94713.1 hypothetical protein I6L52_09255 [Citrobacter braakii]
MDMIKRFKFDVASLALYKVVQVLSTIIITRLLLQQFSVNEYAQIVILTSVSQFVLIDTGTGDSLKKNILSGETDVNKLLANGFIITALLSSLISVAMYIVTSLTPTMHNVSYFDLIIILAVSFLIMPLKICREVLASHQKTYIHSTFLIVFTLLGTLYFLFFKITSIVEAVFIQQAAVLLGNMGCMILLMYHSKFKFSDFKISRQCIKNLLPDSTRFFIIGLSLMVINGADLLLLDYFGASNNDVAEISLVLRICIYTHTFFMFLIYPSWPLLANLKKSNAKKYLKARKLLSAIVFIGGGGASLLVYIFAKGIIDLWTKVELQISGFVILGFVLFTFLRLCADFMDYFLRSDNIFSLQAQCTFAEATFHILLGAIGWHLAGASGFALALPISTFICRIVPYLSIYYINNRVSR